MSRYVTITRPEFIDFLKTIRKPFSLKQGTKGVFVVELSDNVGLAINSTIGDVVRGKAKASIQLSFVSLHSEKFHRVIYGYKKIMQRVVKKKHLQRSMNWRKTLKDAIDKCIAFYNSNNDFLERIALPEDQQQSQNAKELLDRIEKLPKWDTNTFLKSLHNSVASGKILTDKQLKALENTEKNEIRKQEEDLSFMRDLYVSIRRNNGTAEDLAEVGEIGKSLKNKKELSQSELDVLKEICDDYDEWFPQFHFLDRRKKMANQWNKVQLGNKASEIYYRGIPTGSILKVNRGYEAYITIMGKQKSLGVFKSEDRAFEKIQKEKK